MKGGLTHRKVVTAKPGKHSDGGNLYLIVSGTGARKRTTHSCVTIRTGRACRVWRICVWSNTLTHM